MTTVGLINGAIACAGALAVFAIFFLVVRASQWLERRDQRKKRARL